MWETIIKDSGVKSSIQHRIESKTTKCYVHDCDCPFHLISILIGKGALENKRDDKPSRKLLTPGIRKIMFVFSREEAIKVRL